VAFSWRAPFYLDTIDRFNLISANPKFSFQIFGSFGFTLHLGYFEITLTSAAYPFFFTPLDLMFKMDALHPVRNCNGLNYSVTTAMADIKVDTRVNECYFGLLGILTDNDPSDCVWRSYEPELPLYQVQIENIGNIDGTYIPYSC